MPGEKKAKVAPEEAKRFLAVVTPQWKAFWFHEGPVVASLKEMVAVLPKIAKSSFDHHVTDLKNDLSCWVEHVVGDVDLAKDLLKARTAKEAAAVMDKRLKELDKCLIKPAKKSPVAKKK